MMWEMKIEKGGNKMKEVYKKMLVMVIPILLAMSVIAGTAWWYSELEQEITIGENVNVDYQDAEGKWYTMEYSTVHDAGEWNIEEPTYNQTFNVTIEDGVSSVTMNFTFSTDGNVNFTYGDTTIEDEGWFEIEIGQDESSGESFDIEYYFRDGQGATVNVEIVEEEVVNNT